MLDNIQIVEGVEYIAKGTSGRIVVEIDPELKQTLYDALGDEGMSLKQWFLENVEHFLADKGQPTLPLFGAQNFAGKAR